MKILIFTQYFPPEINAPAHRLGFFAKFFAEEKNDSVTVVCEPPNYPQGVLFKGFTNTFFRRETMGNVTVLRSGVWITKRKDAISRILNYGTFCFTSFFAGLRAEKPDVIFASSPPLPVLFSALAVSVLRRVPLVVDIRDIWPESALAVGALKKNFFYRFLERMERYVYKKAYAITVNAEGIGKRLREGRGVSAQKIRFMPNGADLELFQNPEDASDIDKTYNTEGKFVVLFAGLIGLAQDPLVIVDAAKILKDKKEIVFLFVGEGILKKACEDRVRQYGLDNVMFAGQKPREEMPRYFARADVGLNTLSKSNLFLDVISSKVFDYMAAGLPVIFNVEGEGARIARKADCGLFAEVANPRSLAEKILWLYEHPKEKKEMARRARKYAETHYDKKKIASQLHNLFGEVYLES